MSEKIVLVDGNSIFYREYFALPLTLRNKKGEPTNALYGFANQIIKIIKDIKPKYIAVAFDVSKKTFRNDIYDKYKATRKPMPDDLRSQIEPLKKMLNLMNINYVEKQGIEGDDILGTLCKRFANPTIIITGDRDSFQLVDDSTVVYLNRKGMSDIKIMDPKAVTEIYGVTPAQLVFVKALAGDTSDNIPGVGGVGEKTALDLIQKYSDLDGVYQHINEIKGKLKERLLADKDQAYMSLKLAKINTEVDVKCELDDCKAIFPFGKDLYDFFVFNNFRSIYQRDDLFDFDLNEQDLGADINIKELNTKVESIEITKKEILNEAINKIKTNKKVAIYIEDQTLYFSCAETEYKYDFTLSLLPKSISEKDFFEKFKIILEDERIEKICFDCKKEMHFFDKFDIQMNNYFDCMVAKHLVDGSIAVKSIDEVLMCDIKKANNIATKLYNEHNVLLKDLEKLNLTQLYFEVENPLVKVLFKMEKNGFKVDSLKLEELRIKYENELEQLTKQIYDEIGEEFNINSPKQMAEIIYDKLKLSKSKKRSTAVEVLLELEDRHPSIPLIIRYRKVAKFLSTYITGLKQFLDSDNFIHTTFNQALTATGRLSSSEPNLQNIPIRSQESRDIRSIFIASNKDNVLVDADYSQIELRVLAHFTKDEILIDSFKNNLDIHSQTASKIFGVDRELVSSEMRRMAKVVNFGVIYGISEFGLASDLKSSVKDAKNYINQYYLAHPKVERFIKDSILKAKQNGYVESLLGRRRIVPEITSSNFAIRSRAERVSQNMPIQSSSAEIIKKAMIAISNEFESKNLKAKLIMQVHDELIVDCPKDEKEVVEQIMLDKMTKAIVLNVPLEIDIASAYRWSEGH